jgi:hypothetical protein
MAANRDHRDEHPGCRGHLAVASACNRHRLNVNLIAAATGREDHPEGARADRLISAWPRKASKWHLRASSSPTGKTGVSRSSSNLARQRPWPNRWG